MNEYERQARAVKAAALTDVLRAAGATADTLKGFTDADWQTAARTAGVRAPSPATRALVVSTMAIKQPADPLAGLAA